MLEKGSIGIDVNSDIGDVDWKEAASSIDFAMVRISIGYYETDLNFFERVNAIHDAKIPLGLYLVENTRDSAMASFEGDFCRFSVLNELSFKPDFPIFLRFLFGVDAHDNLALYNPRESLEQFRMFSLDLEDEYKTGICADLDFTIENLNPDNLYDIVDGNFWLDEDGADTVPYSMCKLSHPIPLLGKNYPGIIMTTNQYKK